MTIVKNHLIRALPPTVAAIAGLGIAGCAMPAGATGTRQADGGQHGAATTPARPAACTAGQLRLSYDGSQPGAGSDFGIIAIRNGSARACWFAGPLRLTGLSRSGKAITRTITYRQIELGPAGRPSQRGTVLHHGLVATMLVSAEYRDDPRSPDGLCTKHQIEPATWRIVLPSGAVVKVRNADPDGSGSLTKDQGLLTCRGELNSPTPIIVARSAG